MNYWNQFYMCAFYMVDEKGWVLYHDEIGSPDRVSYSPYKKYALGELLPLALVNRELYRKEKEPYEPSEIRIVFCEYGYTNDRLSFGFSRDRLVIHFPRLLNEKPNDILIVMSLIRCLETARALEIYGYGYEESHRQSNSLYSIFDAAAENKSILEVSFSYSFMTNEEQEKADGLLLTKKTSSMKLL